MHAQDDPSYLKNKNKKMPLSDIVMITGFVSHSYLFRFGRRLPLCIFHIFGGVACIIAAFIPEENG